METSKSNKNNLEGLVDKLNSDINLLDETIKKLFGKHSNQYNLDFQLSSLDSLLNFKILLVGGVCDETVRQQCGIKENFKGYVIAANGDGELFAGNKFKPEVQNELDKLKISNESMKVILENFLDNCKFEEINLKKFEILEKSEEGEEGEEIGKEEKKEGEGATGIKVKLASDNDFIKICKFMYQMLYSEKALYLKPFDNGADAMTPLRKILAKYKVFFEKIFNIENIKDYFQNLDKVECEDQTFKKLIDEFGGAGNISSKIIKVIDEVEKDKQTKENQKTQKAKKPENTKSKKNKNTKSKKTKMDWLRIRARIEEICEMVFSVGGLVSTALITLGILPWGALGIGICATLAFIGITRFIATNSWTANHNFGYERKKYFPERKEYGTGILFLFKVFIIPLISLIAGAIFVALGATGVLSLSLGLGLGIPLLGSFVIGGINLAFGFFNPQKNKTKVKSTDNLWGVYMGISAVIAAATFLGLGFGEILALPTAVALAAPLCILGMGIGFLTLFAWVVSKSGSKKLKKALENTQSEISCLGFGYFSDNKYNEHKLLLSEYDTNYGVDKE